MVYIYYLILFKKNQAKTQVLRNYNMKINVTTLVYIAQLRFSIYFINIRAYKIDKFFLTIYNIILASF